eukprot:SAG11_NODE_15040_length_591_cov_0.686992_2_plen_74_part_00
MVRNAQNSAHRGDYLEIAQNNLDIARCAPHCLIFHHDEDLLDEHSCSYQDANDQDHVDHEHNNLVWSCRPNIS